MIFLGAIGLSAAIDVALTQSESSPATIDAGDSGAESRTSADNTPPVMFAPSIQSAWRTDRIWYDGKAEYATYNATRPVYGTMRSYEAVIITNKQYMDPRTTTKSVDWKASGQIEVFKHNVREVIPTENYEYKYLTTIFLRTSDLSPFRLTMASQEDCGSTFKNFIVRNGSVTANTFVYFPGDGPEQSSYDAPDAFHVQDGLTLVLRSFPFDHPPDHPLQINVLPDQTDTHTTPIRPSTGLLSFEGRETLDLPIGRVDAYRLRLSAGGDKAEASTGGIDANYWFAADGGPEWLHILVKYKGPFGVTYQLKSNKRWAYWDRN